MTDNSNSPASTPEFEQAIPELESIIKSLEEGKTSLEESVKAYERGVALKNLCEQKLKQAKMKVEKITTPENGTPQAETF